MKVSVIALVASAASTAVAKNCEAGYLYCGSSLRAYDPKYRGEVEAGLRKNGYPVNDKNVNDSLWNCDSSRKIHFVLICPSRCYFNPGGQDYCGASDDEASLEANETVTSQ